MIDRIAFFDKDATLNGRIGVKLGVDVAGYLEHGSLPDLGTRFDLRRALFYTTGEFRFLLPILFKIDLGGVGDALYVSDVYVWVAGRALRRHGQDRPVRRADVARGADRQHLRDVHGVRLAGRGVRARA